MFRFLLALSLYAFAAAALANNTAASDDPADGNSKPGKTTTVISTQDADATVATHPAAPARSTPRATPRWHSFLPGMIR